MGRGKGMKEAAPSERIWKDLPPEVYLQISDHMILTTEIAHLIVNGLSEENDYIVFP